MIGEWLYGDWFINPMLRLGYTVAKDAIDGGSVTDNSYSRWLTNGEWNSDKYSEYMLYRALPGLSQYTNFLTSMYDDMSYMKNHNLSWDDVKRPWKFSSSNTGSQLIGRSLNFVSDNVKRLYS